MSAAIDIAGWIGAGMLILAYSLVSWERIAARSRTYQWLNIAGSALILLNSVYYHALPSAATNVFWIMVGLSVAFRASSRGSDASRADARSNS